MLTSRYCISFIFIFYIHIFPWTPAVYPSNTQFRAHVGEFLRWGYKTNIGNIECKFPVRDSSRRIEAFTVGVTDGQLKILMCMAITGMVRELEFGEAELKDPQLSMILASFAQIRCSYEHFENPAHFFLYSLRIFSNSLSLFF